MNNEFILKIIPFKPLSQVLSQMEEEAKRVAERDDGSRV